MSARAGGLGRRPSQPGRADRVRAARGGRRRDPPAPPHPTLPPPASSSRPSPSTTSGPGSPSAGRAPAPSDAPDDGDGDDAAGAGGVSAGGIAPVELATPFQAALAAAGAAPVEGCSWVASADGGGYSLTIMRESDGDDASPVGAGARASVPSDQVSVARAHDQRGHRHRLIDRRGPLGVSRCRGGLLAEIGRPPNTSRCCRPVMPPCLRVHDGAGRRRGRSHRRSSRCRRTRPAGERVARRDRSDGR